MKKVLKITGKVLLWILGIIVGLVIISAVVHNILKSVEKNNHNMGQAISVNNKNMHAYVTGQGEKTIVLLSGYGTPSPITDFMPLAEKLSADSRVVILEYFGYGFSDTTKEIRFSENFVNEIRTALQELEISGPYILMPHSISGIYSLYYAINYPDEVEAIIAIDETVPNQTKNDKEINLPTYLTLANTLGIMRDITYLLPSSNDTNKNNYYSAEQVKMKKMATAWNSLNISVINELNMLTTNTKELYDVKYPNDLPVLAFLAEDTVTTDNEWLPLHEEIISNAAIQKNEVLSGEHYLHRTNTDKIVEMTNEFIAANLK